MLYFIKKYYYNFINSTSIITIQNSFIMLLPIILIGSFATLVKSIPIPFYRNFISSFANGFIFKLADYIYIATFGIFSIYAVITLAYNYCQEKMNSNDYFIVPMISALASFMIMTNFTDGKFTTYVGVTGIFTAIICSLLSCKIYLWSSNKITHHFKLYSDGTNNRFNESIETLIPILFISILFGITRFLIFVLFGANSLQDLFIICLNIIFSYLETSFFSGFIYISLNMIMWFFGIHGSNVLDEVANTYFMPAHSMDQLVQYTSDSSLILSRRFFSTFISLGGCGASICLLIAILLFSKRRDNRKLSKVSLIPSIFNISELTVFGLPVVLNRTLLIPFLLTPITIYFISYSSIAIGFVPLPIMDVEWTTPLFISGYLTTNSIRGALLQLVSIIVGVSIYAPFIKRLDKDKEINTKAHLNTLIEFFKETEAINKNIDLIKLQGTNGELAKSLAFDLKNAIKDNTIDLYYQPQFNQHKECIGSETLLRWKHPVYGIIYPPLVIKLAEESSCLFDLEKYIFNKSISEIKKINLDNSNIKKLKFSINISVTSILDERFLKFLKDLSTDIDFTKYSICIEITEQTELKITSEVQDIFTSIRELGYLIALDDFSMGHTSMKYLQAGHFDIVKLDGELIKGLLTNPRSKEIIVSIISLSSSLNFDIVAEYVETEEQLKILVSINCNMFQGYLYSPALPYNDFINLFDKN